MNIDELRTVQTKERQKDSLQHLRDSFYEDVADYIRDLKSERTRAADEASDPFSDPEVGRLTDEIETAEEVVEAIYERRVGKVVKLSSFAAADMPVDEEGLTAQERDLFEDLVARIGQNKSRVLDILAGQGDAGKSTTPEDGEDDSPSETAPETFGGTEEAPAPDSPTQQPPATDDSPSRAEPAFGMGDDAGDSDPSDPAPHDTADDPSPQAPPDTPPEGMADEMVADDEAVPSESTTPDGTEADTQSPNSPSAEATGEPTVQSSTPDVNPEMADQDDDRTTVRITADVGRVLGVDDREYELKSEDVVDLPADNASALLQRDAAEKLE